MTRHTIETLLGLAPSDVTYHQVAMRFPLERRLVYCVNGGRIDHRSMQQDENVRWWLGTIDRIIGTRLDRKGIIHSVSYDRQSTILSGSKYARHMIAPRHVKELPAAIARFRAAGPGAILVSPSVVEGYDFAGDQAEYQILSKLPFPYTRSAIMKARLKRIPFYREVTTAQKIVQAAGRIVRHEGDQGESFIVDEHMRWFMDRWDRFFPDYFLDATVVCDRIPAPPPALAEERTD